MGRSTYVSFFTSSMYLVREEKTWMMQLFSAESAPLSGARYCQRPLEAATAAAYISTVHVLTLPRNGR